MFRAAVFFFVLGLIGWSLGLYGFAGVSMDIGQSLLVVFVILAVASLVVGMITGRNPKVLP